MEQLHLDEWKRMAAAIMKVTDAAGIPAPLDSDGIPIAPYYNLDNADFVSQLSPREPYRSIVEGWVVDRGFEQSVNLQVLDALNNGINTPLFYVYDLLDFPGLLKDVNPEYIRINWVVEGDPVHFLDRYLHWLHSQSIETESIAGALPHDLFEIWTRTGGWLKSEQEDWDQWNQLVTAAPASLQVMGVHANIYHHAGATPAQELGIALSAFNEYAERLNPETAWPHGWVNVALSSDFFHDIAKLRAYRELYAIWAEQRGFEQAKLWIHAQTGLRDKDPLEPTNNLVRNTWQTMAGWLGGADEIWTKPHDEPEGGQPFSRRIARNVNNLLSEESGFNTISDAASGSFYLESLTRELVSAGWAMFQSIEDLGGLMEALKSGFVQNEVAKSGEKWLRNLAEQKQILVGVNKYGLRNRSFVDSAQTDPKNTDERVFPPLKTVHGPSLFPENHG